MALLNLSELFTASLACLLLVKWQGIVENIGGKTHEKTCEEMREVCTVIPVS